MPSLSGEQRNQFEHEGYVVVEEVFDPVRDLDPVVAEYAEVLGHLAEELFEAGEISSTYSELPFGARLTAVYADSGKVHAQYFDFALPFRGVTPETPMWTGPAVFALLRHDGLLDAVESLIGSEIYSNPVQHVRLKPPERLVPTVGESDVPQLGATPWHQDNGVVNEDADETEMVTVWFPLFDTTADMGSLVVLPGSHRQGLLTHCAGSDPGGLRVPESLFEASAGVPIPLPRGAALFMHRRTLHSSLHNTSEQLRCSFDLRYHPVGQPTGRGAFPGFVARSRERPESELRDAAVWTALWQEARRAMAAGEPPRFNRWDANAPVCA